MFYTKLTKNLNKRLIFLIAVMVFLLAIPSFIGAFAEDEGTLGDNPFWVFFANLFYVIRFPTHNLFGQLILIGGPFTYFGGLILNSLFYGYLIERLIYVLNKTR